nr:MAG TPA: hypothetical protein [Caudoviricetes sp.]
MYTRFRNLLMPTLYANHIVQRDWTYHHLVWCYFK